MVVKAEPGSVKKEQNLVFITPTTVNGLKTNAKELGVNTVLLKLSMDTCPPCKKLSQWLRDLKVTKKVVVCEIDIQQQTELSQLLVKQYNVKSVPLLAYSTVNFKPLGTPMLGLNTDQAMQMINAYKSTVDLP